jgi:RHS repeat-associated protein
VTPLPIFDQARLVLSRLIGRRRLLRRTAPIWIGLLVTVRSAIPPAPTGVPLPIRPVIPVALAGYPCSSHSGEWTTFTGHLSNSSGTQLSESTSGDVYGRISNVDRTWQLSPGCGYYRYDAVLWATTNDTTHLRVDWGALSGDAQPCIYLLNTSDYLHANSGACPGVTTARLVATLTPETTYHNDVALDNTGDFAFAHSDCITWYGVEPIKTGASTSVTSGEPGANCGNKQLDGTGTTQTLVFDGTAPTISFSFPAAGGPVLVPSAFAGVTFTATDAVAGFAGTDDWDLQRQVATWNGSVCGTFANDTGDKALVSGTTNAANQVSSQSLALGKCYRWTLGARDQNGNTATTITSGSIRTDTSSVWGDQPQFRQEGWDLGAGDTLSVSVGSGNVRLDHPIVSLPIRAGSLDLSLSYNSHDAGSVGVGPGWRLNVQRRLTVNADNTVTFTDAYGSRHTFTNPTGSPTVTYTRPATLYATLTRDTAATPDRFTLTYRDLSVDVFDEDIAGAGLLKQVKDRNGNTVSVAYSTADKISTITDPASRTISFTWTGSNLTQIVDWANVSGGIVQASGSGNRTHRFFYDVASPYNLIGWADPLNTSGSCPTAGSHLTCLTYTAGLLTAIAKTQTYETISGNPGTLSTATRTITTSIAYTFADVTSVNDAEAAATTFSHPSSGVTKAVRPGTPASETTYALVSATDTYGRIGSVKRKLASAQIETATTYDATYPIEPATLTEDKAGSLQRITNYTYQASSLGLLGRLDEPLDGTYRRYTDYMYNTNNDVTKKDVYSTDAATAHTETRYCYTPSGCSTSATDLLLRSQIDNYVDGTAGGANGQVEDVTTTYQYDAYGQRTRATRANYQAGGTLLDQAATGWTYDTSGNLTAEIRNYADGAVSNPGDDVTPNATTNARTDLTTAYTYDTAGNRVSTADPRRAIEAAKGTSLSADDFIGRTIFDALNQTVTSRLPTTPGQTDCSPTPACREATTIDDELGAVREAADINDLVTATKYDKAGRALETYEDPVSTTASITGINTYDSQGRLLTSKNQEQSKTGSTLGYTQQVYDELGRMLAQAWAVGTSVDTETDYGYDSLDRRTSMVTGVEDSSTSQTTIWTYDTGGRTTKVDDEFTCTSTTYDYHDLATQVVEGQASGACSGGGIRTVTNTSDGLGRLTLSQVTAGTGLNDKLAENTYDGAGHALVSSATTSGVTTSTTFTINLLDQAIAEVTNNTWAKTNFDAAGGATDRCLWAASPTDPCKPAGSTFNSPQPTSVTTTTYDGRNNRISLQDAVASTTTTYDPNHNYQLWAVYLPTGGTREHQTIFAYDSRHRLTTVNQILCATAEHPQCTGGNILATTASDTYAYDDNDNRTQVNEANGNGSLNRYYCYDAVERVISTRSASGCSSGLIESYTYDDSGNRTAAGSTTFTYDAQGQLASCNPTCGTVAFDAAGRTQKWNGWVFEYDAQGRMTRACQSTTDCTGLYNEVEYTYDGEGHRTQIKQYNSGSGTAVATWDFRYQGDAIVEEKLTDAAHPSGTVVRSYVVDEAGSIVKLTVPAGETGAGTYLVTWSGHGDALALWRLETDGSLTLANSYTYTTWGTPTTATHNGIADLGFRFLYVGEYDVQWDNTFGLGLVYMHARHYSPALGRFLQPDPDGSEANLYAYAANNPVTEMDPDGTCFIICAIINAVVSVAIYAVTTDSKDWNLADAGREAAIGFGTGLIGIGLFDKIAKIGKIASGISRLTSAVSRGAAVVSKSSRIGAALVRQATRAARFVARDRREDWFRIGKTNVPPTVSGLPKYRLTTAIRGGGTTKTGFTLPFHYHIHQYNFFKPWNWFD